MKSESAATEPASALPRIGTTLQAVLQRSDGTMDSIAVPVPLPEVIVRLEARSAAAAAPADDLSLSFKEVVFRRNRSGDSVLRYVEEEAESPARSSARRCARCGELRSVYFVPKLAAQDPFTAETPAYCEECYGSAAS